MQYCGSWCFHARHLLLSWPHRRATYHCIKSENTHRHKNCWKLHMHQNENKWPYKITANGDAQLSDNPFGLASYHSQTSSPATCMTPLSARYCTHILQAPRITRYRPLCQRHIGLQPSQIQKDMIYEGLRFLVQLVTNVSYIAHEEQCDISVQHSEVSFQLNNLVLKY